MLGVQDSLCNNLPQDPSGRISLSLHAEVEFLPLRSQAGDVESSGSRFAGVGLDPVVEVELPVGQVGRILDGEVLTLGKDGSDRVLPGLMAASVCRKSW